MLCCFTKQIKMDKLSGGTEQITMAMKMVDLTRLFSSNPFQSKTKIKDYSKKKKKLCIVNCPMSFMLELRKTCLDKNGPWVGHGWPKSFLHNWSPYMDLSAFHDWACSINMEICDPLVPKISIETIKTGKE